MSHPIKLPLSRALLWILLYTLLISGTAWMGWLYYLQLREKRVHDAQYRIVAIVQSGPHKDSLKTVYLAELLNLSIDRPQNLNQFNILKAHKRLMASPLIKEATISKIRPGTIYIDYAIRSPVAFLGDYSNTALDEEAYLFPFNPFFTPKNLPIFYLGLEKQECRWGQSLIEHAGLKLALQVIEKSKVLLKEMDFVLKQVDVSQAFADSFGKRQIVLLFEEIIENKGAQNNTVLTQPFIVRLNTAHYEQNLANFLALKQHLDQERTKAAVENLPPSLKPIIVDLRISQLAFIQKVL